jgi:PadR family transcriptional regulator PadR
MNRTALSNRSVAYGYGSAMTSTIRYPVAGRGLDPAHALNALSSVDTTPTSCRVLHVARSHSTPTRLVFQAFLDAPSDETYGFELAQATGLASGTIYPILRRLEDDGWIRSRWAEVETGSQRRRRKYYELTGAGRRVAQEATAEQRTALRLLSAGWSSA